MSVEYTNLDKKKIMTELELFLESQPDDAVFRLVMSSKGYFKVNKKKKSRIGHILGKLRFRIRRRRA